MNMIVRLLVAVIMICGASMSMAKDKLVTFPVEDALNTDTAKEKLAGVDFYFGGKKPAGKVKKLVDVKTSKKTNAFKKTDQETCQWAFLSALIALHQRAEREGGNAVINIKSNIKHKVVSSDTEYQCARGFLMSNVALKGTVVTVSKK